MGRLSRWRGFASGLPRCRVRTTDAGTLSGRRRVTNVLESGRGGTCGERTEIRGHGRADRGLLGLRAWLEWTSSWFGTGAGNVAIAAAAASSLCTDVEWAAWFGTGAGNVAIAAAAASASRTMPAPLRVQCLG